MRTIKKTRKSKHHLIWNWLVLTYAICSNQWHKQKHKTLLVLIVLLGLLVINWFILDIPIQSYNAYHKYMPFVSCLTTKQAKDTKEFVKNPSGLLSFTGKKQIIWFSSAIDQPNHGVHIQISKKDLIDKKDRVPIDSKIIPQDYVPYAFDSITFGKFKMLAKQTLLSNEILKDPNCYNNFYTITTNVKQGGLYAANTRMYNNNKITEINVPKRFTKRKNLIPFVGPEYCFDLEGEGDNYDILAPAYIRRGLQDSPDYISNQIIKGLKAIPENCYLDLSINIRYSVGGIPNSVVYTWCYFYKHNTKLVGYKYDLPILHKKTVKGIANRVIVYIFPPATNYYPDEIKYDFEKPGTLYSDGFLSYQTILHGYHATADSNAMAAFDDSNGKSIPLACEQYTTLLNYFSSHKRELRQVKLYAEIGLLIEALVFLWILALFDSLFAKSINKVAHKE